MLIGLESERHRPVRVGFVGFHSSFNRVWNNVTHSLLHRFALDVSEPESHGSNMPTHLATVPDFLFYSVFDALHKDRRYDRCVKVFTCEENFPAPWGECRYAMTGDYSPNPHHLRLPIYVRAIRHFRDHPHPTLRSPCPTLVKDPKTDWRFALAHKTEFCAFVCSNESWRDPRSRGECGLALRTRFFDILSEYRRVDSGGRVRNNLGRQVEDKPGFLQNYKFTVAFENASYPGYVSEKLVEPMVVGSVPIYWGSPELDDDFNPRSMVVATGRRLADVVDEVAALDRDDAAYLAKLREPWFHGNVQNRYCSADYLADFLARVFDKRIP